MNHYGFEQLVNLPTRENYILDLVLFTHPDMIAQVEVVPGISDHKAITFQLYHPLNRSPASKLERSITIIKLIHLK